ncbi:MULTISPECIES: hypothetical protein [unclassified Kitasatospora]|uniref:hypothetical protein n=1 Tax=unclassified Kitasatospora TaxID=2633591 RepID=UPI000DB9E689|nr:hypothetical protein [Kitasatospora sp. SolWspMP-SS2h]RAJ44919.1 hypothetical protein K353_01497 [Kitasatospora sp. SolWspMP-SS2h]
MDAGVQRAVTGLEESRAKLREEAVVPLRVRREAVPAADEHLLLGAIAELMESLQELTDVTGDRRTTPDAGLALTTAAGRLAGTAELLRAAEQRARKNA